MDMETLVQLTELIGQFGLSVVFLWLFVRESNKHEDTRKHYRADLREIAGMRAERFIQGGDSEGIDSIERKSLQNQ